MEQQSLTRGQLAKRSGKTFETIRFYEEKGLIRHHYRDSSNYRRYRSSDSDRLAFIDQAKQLGFSLREIGEILEIHDREAGACKNLSQKAQLKLEEIEAQIKELEERRALLQRFQNCAALDLADCDCDIIAQASGKQAPCDCG
ncbi:MerR family DNA-binding protein [Pelagicoccus sp. SDUM812005]|uniref:MerR family DNA-binding protein n=1 Tax=Pelagicoccus sp. SDUM812005 TaxID=3041257 RepID=UPI00280CA91B|nr:MerR family DNA-binding protein [Pelagicoccus sp. SDUM812005]MDQ8182998.1 MerR family DNA-binding protein [Pelagicoccus sp. SDUM812005]